VPAATQFALASRGVRPFALASAALGALAALIAAYRAARTSPMAALREE
jgi:ABC-type antimicrobial peptide transport system permease subunit